MVDGRSEIRSGAPARTAGQVGRVRTASVGIAGLILLLFGTPMSVLWMDSAGSWWLGYLLWLAAIALIAVTARPGR